MLTVLACIFVPLGVIWLLVVSPSFRTAAVILVALILITIGGIWNWFQYSQDSYGEPALQTKQVIEDNNRHQKETATIDAWCRANVAGVDIKHWKSVIIPAPTNVKHSVSLLKNLSDHRACSSATATVGHVRKFVHS
jgi:hypothetical protein